MPPPRPRLRVPDDAVLDAADKLSTQPAGTDVLHARLRLLTPAILGGADARKADTLAPIRTKAVRGQLRHWWRLLAAAGAFAEWGVAGGDSDADAQRLKALEFETWGALPASRADAAAADTADIASRIGMEVLLPSLPRHLPAGQARRAHPDLALGLYFAGVKAEGEGEDGRHVAMPPWSFELVLTTAPGGHPHLAAMLARTVVCWATLSGIGGRTSRGMGAVVLDSLRWTHADGTEEPLPCMPEALSTRPVPAVINLFGLATGVFIDPANKALPGTAERALGWGLLQAMQFLQVSLGRPAAKAMSLWPEARLIRHLTGDHYIEAGKPWHHHDPRSTPAGLPGGTPPVHVAPRIAFGHRMIRFVAWQTQGRHGDPLPHAIVPKGSDRLPSSVLIRPFPWPGAPGRYGCLVVQRSDLAGDRLPIARLRAGRTQRHEDLRAWSPNWQAGQTGGCAGIAPLERTGCGAGVFTPPRDAGQAFINWLQSST